MYINKILVTLFAVVLVFVIFLSFSVNKTKKATDKTSQNVKITESTIKELYHLQSAVYSLQLETNGFLVTGDTSFLVTYNKLKKSTPGQMFILRNIVNDDTGQQFIDSVTEKISALTRVCDRYIALKKNGRFNPDSLNNKVFECAKRRKAAIFLLNNLVSDRQGKLALIKRDNNKSIEHFQKLYMAWGAGIWALIIFAFFSIQYNLRRQTINERILKQSEKRFKIFFNHNPVATSITELQTGRILYVNDAYENLFIVQRKEVIGQTVVEAGISNQQLRLQTVMRIMELGGGVKNMELQLTTRNGEVKDLYANFDTIEIEGLTCLLSSFLDISENKIAAEKLRQSEKKFSIITRMTPVPVFISEVDSGKFLYVNNAFCRLFDMTYEDIVGKTSVELNLFSAEYRNMIAQKVLKDGGHTDNLEIKLMAMGVPRDILLSSDIIEIDNKKCFLATTLDISDRKRSEDLLRSAYLKEKELSALKSNFVTVASHEFRTPLTTILSSAGLLEKYNTTNRQEDRLRHINKIAVSTKRLVEILDDLLSLEDLEKGTTQPDIYVFDMEKMVRTLCDDLRNTIAQKCRLTYEHSGDPMVTSDPAFIRHILYHLLSNAIKYSTDENPLIELFTIAEGRKLTLRVKDYGTGIPEEDQKYLFRRFYKGKSAKNQNQGGTGMGLYIAKKYTDILGGTINVKSAAGKGSEFIVEI